MLEDWPLGRKYWHHQWTWYAHNISHLPGPELWSQHLRQKRDALTERAHPIVQPKDMPEIAESSLGWVHSSGWKSSKCSGPQVRKSMLEELTDTEMSTLLLLEVKAMAREKCLTSLTMKFEYGVGSDTTEAVVYKGNCLKPGMGLHAWKHSTWEVQARRISCSRSA